MMRDGFLLFFELSTRVSLNLLLKKALVYGIICSVSVAKNRNKRKSVIK